MGLIETDIVSELEHRNADGFIDKRVLDTATKYVKENTHKIDTIANSFNMEPNEVVDFILIELQW